MLSWVNSVGTEEPMLAFAAIDYLKSSSWSPWATRYCGGSVRVVGACCAAGQLVKILTSEASGY